MLLARSRACAPRASGPLRACRAGSAGSKGRRDPPPRTALRPFLWKARARVTPRSRPTRSSHPTALDPATNPSTEAPRVADAKHPPHVGAWWQPAGTRAPRTRPGGAASARPRPGAGDAAPQSLQPRRPPSTPHPTRGAAPAATPRRWTVGAVDGGASSKEAGDGGCAGWPAGKTAARRSQDRRGRLRDREIGGGRNCPGSACRDSVYRNSDGVSCRSRRPYYSSHGGLRGSRWARANMRGREPFGTSG